MTNIDSKQIVVHQHKFQSKYGGPSNYRVNGVDYEVAPWNLPANLANDIMLEADHTVATGAQFIGPMGRGKTALATVIAHHIHTKKPWFNVHWAGTNEFKNLLKYLESLPKYQPCIIIFDDITSALKSMSEKDLHRNFNILTRIRHILDPKKGKTQVIIFTTSHYSKNLEKEFRAVLDRTVFLAFGNEERTNIDTIAPKNSQARLEITKFAKMYTKLYSEGTFYIHTGNGKKLEYVTSKPFRPSCAVSGTDCKIILFAESDSCETCRKKKLAKMVPAKEVFAKILKSYGPAGVQAMKMYLWKKGIYSTLQPQVARALLFLEDRFFTELTTDLDDLATEWYAYSHKKKPSKTLYRKRKMEDENMSDFYDIAFKPEPPKKPTIEDNIQSFFTSTNTVE